jgi:EAL domain-containing protein (putative c-di-GMP-specific phosphodiesterase class I)/ActR/RegA family two-component response regulator
MMDAPIVHGRPYDHAQVGRVLVFDDDREVGWTIGSIARRMGLQARVVCDSAEFVLELDAFAPTHIVLNLVMPKMDGVEALSLLARRGSRAMIIIASGVSGRVLEAAQRSGVEQNLIMAGVLPKPFDAAALRELLARDPPVFNSLSRPPMERATPDVEITADDLRRGLEANEIELAYQPKIECMTGRLVGFEALARWRHPTVGLVMPDRFVPLAEASELIDILTEQVIAQASSWLASALAPADLVLSINISARNLKNIHLADSVSVLCGRHGIAPERLILELTETATMEDPVASLSLLTRLRMKGFRLSIDDFGTGHSSMIQLVRQPFSEVKIDKSFVISSAHSEESRAVIKSIVDLGHSLKLKTAAEGVEDAAALTMLKNMGCDLAQGYFIGRPMPGDKVASWIEAREATAPRA